MTNERLKLILYYDSSVGFFIHLIDKKRIKKNTIAGHINKQGYCIIKVDGKSYKAHSLVLYDWRLA